MVADSMLRFWTTFRSATHRMLELSIGPEDDQGLLTGGEASLPSLVWKFAADHPFASDWVKGATRFVAGFPSIRYLFRTDWRSSRLAAMTLYVRLPDDLAPGDFLEVLDRAEPIRWPGSTPFAISEAIGRRAPSGFATRVDCLGRLSASVYWYINQSAYVVHRSVLRPLAQWLSWPEHRCDEMILAVQRVAATEGLAVLGVAGHTDMAKTTVKLDLANVGIEAAASLLEELGTPKDDLARLARTANHLGVGRMSYLGLKMGRSGWTGWKAYFGYEPMLRRSAALCRLVAPTADRPRPPASSNSAGFTPLSFS